MKKHFITRIFLPVLTLALTIGAITFSAIKSAEVKADASVNTITDVHVRGSSASDMSLLLKFSNSDYPSTSSTATKSLSTVISDSGANFLDKTFLYFNDDTHSSLRNLLVDNNIFFSSWGESNSLRLKINISSYAEEKQIPKIIFYKDCSFPCFTTTNCYKVENNVMATYSSKVASFLYLYSVKESKGETIETEINGIHVRNQGETTNHNDLFILIGLSTNDYTSVKNYAISEIYEASFLNDIYIILGDESQYTLDSLVRNNLIRLMLWNEKITSGSIAIGINGSDTVNANTIKNVYFAEGCSFPSYSNPGIEYYSLKKAMYFKNNGYGTCKVGWSTSFTEIVIENETIYSSLTSATINNNLLTFTFADSDYSEAGSNAVVNKEKISEFNYLYTVKIETVDYTKFLIDLVNEAGTFYYNYNGINNSFTIPLISPNLEIKSLTINKSAEFPSAKYTGYNETKGKGIFTSYLMISEVSLINKGGTFVDESKLNNDVLIDYVSLGDVVGEKDEDVKRTWFVKLIGSDYPLTGDSSTYATVANIDVHNMCLASNTYDKILVDNKSVRQYMNEGKLIDHGFINRFTRWACFSFAIDGIDLSTASSHTLTILPGCQFPAFNKVDYFSFNGTLTTTTVNTTTHIYQADCSLGQVSLKAGDPNGDITERFFLKLSKSDYDHSYQITGDDLTVLLSNITIDTTAFSKSKFVSAVYANGMGRSDTLSFTFNTSSITDLKDTNHIIKVSKDITLPAQSNSLTNYIKYYYKIDRNYEFSNQLSISNGEWFDKSKVELFVTNDMHMSDYNESLGYCKDDEHHYYKTAKATFLTFNDYEIKYLKINHSDAYARLESWAHFNGEELSNDTFIKVSSNEITILKPNNVTNTIVIIGMILTIFEIICFIGLKKKKKN